MDMVLRKEALLVIGSPMCRAFSQLQSFNGNIHKDQYWKMQQDAREHLKFCMALYQIQIDNGMYFLHEHPYSAKSWDLPEVKSISQQPGVETIRGDMCCFGMYQDTPGGPMLVKKPTGFMTNAAGISAELGIKCEGGHKHIQLLNCLLYTSPSPRDKSSSRMPSSA